MPRRKPIANRRRWVRHVQETSNAMDLPEGIFTRSSKAIASGLKSAAEHSMRTKGSKLQSAMSMLNFYINRAGRALPASAKARLSRAKTELRRIFGRE